MANVDAERAHRSAVAEAKTDRVCVITRELVEINVAVDVAAIVKNDAAQTAFQWNGEAYFRIHDGEHMSADRHANQRTGGSIGGITANSNRPLRARAVYGESAQRIGASGEESLAQRHVAARERRYKTDAKVVCIGQPRTKRQIEGGLSQEARKIAAGAQGGRSDAEGKCLIETVMGVQRLIASIADILGGKCGEPHVLILRQDQIWNGYVAEIGALKAVTYADGLGALRVQSFFYLPGGLS